MLSSINCSPNKHKPPFCAAIERKGAESKCCSEFFLRTCQDCNINLDESARYLDWEVFITSGNGMFKLLSWIVITDTFLQLCLSSKLNGILLASHWFHSHKVFIHQWHVGQMGMSYARFPVIDIIIKSYNYVFL